MLQTQGDIVVLLFYEEIFSENQGNIINATEKRIEYFEGSIKVQQSADIYIIH